MDVEGLIITNTVRPYDTGYYGGVTMQLDVGFADFVGIDTKLTSVQQFSL